MGSSIFKMGRSKRENVLEHLKSVLESSKMYFEREKCTSIYEKCTSKCTGYF